MKILMLMLMLFSLSSAEGIDSLLQEYEKESELSHKTKDESAGNLIVYTRDDLERMQVETLSDILKSFRFFPYTENRTARPDILNQDPLTYSSKNIRVYLNETELLTAITGSGFILFGDMEMDFIDHVEIYQGFPSFDFGVEPATILIRLYSKTAEHDEGGRIKATLSTNGANKENVYYSNKEDGISYFMYANRMDNKQDSYEHHGETLKRDMQTNRFYGSLASQNHRVELHAMKQSGDSLLGPILTGTPENSNGDISFLNLSTNSKFLDNSLTLNLSYINTDSTYKYNYNPADSHLNGKPLSSFEQNLEEESFTSTLKKEFVIDFNTITVGLQYRYKHFDASDISINNIPKLTSPAYSKETIYSGFIEDLITLDDNNLISVSLMSQLYKRENNVEDDNALQLRLGYIYSDKEWVSKTFLSSQEFVPGAFMALNTPNELKSETFKSLIQEISYQTEKTISKVVVAYAINENMPILDQATGKVSSSTIESNSLNTAIEFTLHFNKKDKLELQANCLNLKSPYNGERIIHYNYMIRMLNTISKFDIYNELVINDNFTNVNTGYNYSLGVKYQISRDFHINLKGDNIFDSALEWDYLSPTPTDPTDTFVLPIIEQRFTLGMEYLF